MVLPNLRIKLIDFGYGEVIKEANQLFKKFCGTPYYMPPEIIEKKSYNGTSLFI